MLFLCGKSVLFPRSAVLDCSVRSLDLNIRQINAVTGFHLQLIMVSTLLQIGVSNRFTIPLHSRFILSDYAMFALFEVSPFLKLLQTLTYSYPEASFITDFIRLLNFGSALAKLQAVAT